MAFPVIVCWLEAAAVAVPLYHMLCCGGGGQGSRTRGLGQQRLYPAAAEATLKTSGCCCLGYRGGSGTNRSAAI